MGELEKILLDWGEFGQLSKDFAKRIQEKYCGEIEVVVGIAKGGLPLSVYVSNHLGTEWDSIRIGSYTGDAVRGEMRLIHGLHKDVEGKTIMLVDDIVDEGKTMQFTIDYLNRVYNPKKIITAALILKPRSTFKPDEYLQERGEWIVFPWEADSKKC